MNVNDRAAALLAKRKNEARPSADLRGSYELKATRNAFLDWAYGVGLVEASAFSGHLADKLLFARCVENLAPHSTFQPKSRGIGEISLPLSEGLRLEFPEGCVVKPVAGMNSDGEGVYLNSESFLVDFALEPEKFLPTEKISPLTGLLSSGESFLAQESIGDAGREYRLHTLEGRVVRGATFTRWDQAWCQETFDRAEAALQGFLMALPPWFVAGQAWSVDVIEGREFRLVEVNTNRGETRHWSGDLSAPDTLRAYALHLERYYGVEFTGEGRAFREGRANEAGYLKKFGAEAVARHERLRRLLNGDEGET